MLQACGMFILKERCRMNVKWMLLSECVLILNECCWFNVADMWNITKMLSVANPLHISPRVNKLGFSDRMQGIEEAHTQNSLVYTQNSLIHIRKTLCRLKRAVYICILKSLIYTHSKESYKHRYYLAEFAPQVVPIGMLSCVTWLLHMCTLTPLYMWHDLLEFVTELVYMICVPPSEQNVLLRVKYLVQVCDVSIDMCDLTHSYVWHNAFICATWHIHMCNMQHLYVDICTRTRVYASVHTIEMHRWAKKGITNKSPVCSVKGQCILKRNAPYIMRWAPFLTHLSAQVRREGFARHADCRVYGTARVDAELRLALQLDICNSQIVSSLADLHWWPCCSLRIQEEEARSRVSVRVNRPVTGCK